MYVTPEQASKFFCVSETCLRNWADNGKIKYTKTKGGHRRYFIEPTNSNSAHESDKGQQISKVIYCRVSSRKQSDDLNRQKEFLVNKYPDHEVIKDIGSGINWERRGLKRILEGVFNGEIKEVVVAHRDRLTRLGYTLFEWIFKVNGTNLICVDDEEPSSSDRELQEDLMLIVTLFTAKHHRWKYSKGSKLLQENQILSKQ